MGNVINSCPNSSSPLKSVNLKNINNTCVKCGVSSFDTGTCNKTCEDENNNSVLTQTRTIITQPVGGWTCPPLTQTISPCPGLLRCALAVVSTKFNYSNTDIYGYLNNFTISSNNNMYMLFSTYYILQINLSTNVSKRIDIPFNYTITKITSSIDNDILYIYDNNSVTILKYTVSTSTFNLFYSNIRRIYDFIATKDSSNNDVLYCCENNNSISKIYFNNGVLQKDIIVSFTYSTVMYIAISKDSLGNDVIYITDGALNNIKKIYKNNNVYIYEIIAGSPNGYSGYSNELNNSLFRSPAGITFYNDNLYVSDRDNQCIRKINLTTKVVSTIAGSTSGIVGFLDGNGVNNSLFNAPEKIIYYNKVIYVLDFFNRSIRKIVDFIQPVCSSVAGYISDPNNPNICQCSVGYTGTFVYTDNIISGCNKIYPSQTGYIGTPGNYTCDTSKGYGGTVVYGANSLSGCNPIPCTSTGYTGPAGSCICISGYNGVVTYTYDGILGGCTPKTYTLTTGYTGTPGNYRCDTSIGYGGTVVYGANSLSGCKLPPTGFIGTPGAYTCDISKGYEGTVIYGTSLYVACGQGTNTLAYSNDGTTWTGLNTTIFSTAGICVAYGKDRWIAGGRGGTSTLVWSNDGIKWNSLGNSIFNLYASCIAYGNDRWVAGGSGSPITNTLAWSFNGTIWTGLGSSIFTSYTNSVAYGNGIWVACGGVTMNTLAWSSNGTIWNGLGTAIFSGFGIGVAYANGLWVACGNGVSNTLAYSKDGIQWTGLGISIFTTNGYCVAYGNGLWVAGGDGTKNTLAYSNDGITWTGIILNNIACRCLTYGKDLWVSNVGNSLLLSNDGIQWNISKNTIFTTAGYGIAYKPEITGCNLITYPYQSGYTGTPGNYSCDASKGYTGTVGYNNKNIFVACGQGTYTLAYSNDGDIWSSLGNTIFSSVGYCVAYGNGKWVAGGLGTNTLAYSNDGTLWSGLGTTIFNSAVYGITYGNGRWVACGQGTLHYLGWSDDGIQWTGLGMTIFTNNGNCVAYGNGRWVAGGYSGGTGITQAWSDDGITWNSSTRIFTNTCNGVAYGNGLWVACGNSGTTGNTLAWSSNGSVWTGLGMTIFTGSGLCVAYGNGRWVAGGKGTNTLAWSDDGTQWNSCLGNFSTNGNCVAYGNGLWVAGGNGTSRLSTDGKNWVISKSTFSYTYGVSYKLSLTGCTPSLPLFYIVGLPSSTTTKSPIIYTTNNFTSVNITQIYSSSSFTPSSIYYNKIWNLWVCTINVSGSSIDTFAYSDIVGKWTISQTKANGIPSNTNLNQIFDSNNEFCIAITDSNFTTTILTGTANTAYETYSGINGYFMTLMYYSTDGKIWNPIKGFPSRNKYCMSKGPRCIKFANNIFVVGLSVLNSTNIISGGFSMLVSTTPKPTLGSNFTPVSCFDKSCCSIEFANNKWIALGIHMNQIAYSTSTNNAVTWSTPQYLSSLNVLENNLIIKYGYNKVWMIGGRGNSYNFLVSTDDGISWKPTGNVNQGIFGIKYINNTWYSYGYSPNLLKSTDDGATWTSINLSSNVDYIYCLGWNGM